VSAILVKDGPLAGRRVELDGDLVIGREDGGLTIDDAEMSRRHAVVRVVGAAVEIEDLGSRNGTFVNGHRIAATTRLAAGDSVKLGKTVLVVELPRAAETVASAAVPAAVAPRAAPDAVPSEPFGAYLAPAAARPLLGIASRQLVPMVLSWGVVIATAVALVAYFAQHR
jgi:pSer/pThr/pTyr-binding forkhead associated (FHA) protein